MSHRILATLFAVTLFALPTAAAADSAAQAEPDVPLAGALVGTAVCGHVDDLLAAREALRAGSREDALRHLKAARSLLASCEERVGVTADGAEPADTLEI